MKKIFSVMLSLCFILLLSACPDSGQAGGEGQPSAPETSGESTLLDDDFIKADYLEVFEADGVEGVFYLSLRVENKSDKEIWVYLSDALVNGVSTTMMSGVPMTIPAGAASQSPFIISYSNLDISELEQLETIQFKFSVNDNETSQNLEVSDTVSIQFN